MSSSIQDVVSPRHRPASVCLGKSIRTAFQDLKRDLKSTRWLCGFFWFVGFVWYFGILGTNFGCDSFP
jgi:hypothetical protein